MTNGTVWVALVSVGVGAAVSLAGTVLNHRLGLSRARTKAKEENDRSARYLAIRVICILEPFVRGCASVAADQGRPDGEGGFDPDAPEPSLAYPDDVEWRSIDPDLMFRALNLQNEIRMAKDFISFSWEHESENETFRERQYRFAGLGLAAVGVVADLRKMAGLPPQDYEEEYWNPRKVLERAYNHEKTRRDSAARSSRNIIESAEEKAREGSA